MSVKAILQAFLALLAGAAALFGAVGGWGRPWAGFAAGEALFALNLLLLVWLARRLFLGAAGEERGGRRRGALLGFLLFVKTCLLAVGAYLVLVPADLPPLPFIGGCGAGLAALVVVTLAAAAAGRREAKPGAALR